MTVARPRFALLVLTFIATGCGEVARNPTPAAPAATSAPAAAKPPVRITRFAWPYGQEPLATRGGSTTGETTVLSPSPSAAWTEMQAATGKARDHAAILAMAGDYRVAFDFQETLTLKPGMKLAAPYQSWATERIVVIVDTPDRISLQHQLVMRIAGMADAIVTKHWRQDWSWQDGDLLRFQGLDQWRHEKLPAAAVAGTWTQAVFGVGDEPRYETIGRWQHSGSLSEWTSDRHLRPLPRREQTVRKDYQALQGLHRITITPDGWVLWQESRKLALTGPDQPAADPYVAVEVGCERYQRISGHDWSPGIAAWKGEEAFWAVLRATWAQTLDAHERMRVPTEGGAAKIGIELLEDAIAHAGGDAAALERGRARVIASVTATP